MIYFVSDIHLGLQYGSADPHQRERRAVEWLRSVENDCQKLFLVGDIFDFWFEYKRLIPKGFARLFGQLAAMADRGIEIHFFVGNHDLWVDDYFQNEFGFIVHTEPYRCELQGRQVIITHGDNLGKRDWAGRTLSKWFRNPTLRWLFQHLLHPDAAMRFGQKWSTGNRSSRGCVSHTFRSENEAIVGWAREQLATGQKVDYFVMGHLHTPIIYDLGGDSRLVVLGEWIENPTVGKMDNGQITLIKIT